MEPVQIGLDDTSCIMEPVQIGDDDTSCIMEPVLIGADDTTCIINPVQPHPPQQAQHPQPTLEQDEVNFLRN